MKKKLTEAVVHRCSIKYAFKKISQSLQENTCILFFNKVALLQLQLKKKLWHWCFPVNFAIENSCFIEHLIVTAFELSRGNIELTVQVTWVILHINQASKFQAKFIHVDFYRNIWQCITLVVTFVLFLTDTRYMFTCLQCV